MGLTVSRCFVEKLGITKVLVIPKVIKCGLELQGGLSCLCSDTITRSDTTGEIPEHWEGG